MKALIVTILSLCRSDDRAGPVPFSSSGAGPRPQHQVSVHESGHLLAARAMNFPIKSATIVGDEWFSGICLAPLSQANTSPEQEIAAAEALCDQAKMAIGDRLGQDPAEFAIWRTHAFARCTILAAGRCAELLVFADADPLSNSLDQALSRIFAESVCAPTVVEAYLYYVEAEATALLVDQRHALDALAGALETAKTLDGEAVDQIIGNGVSGAIWKLNSHAGESKPK